MEICQIKIYAIILNYNSASDSVFLFRSLKKLEVENLVILVIDNNSQEKDQYELIQNIPEENLIFSKRNLGYAAGNNVGIDLALKANADYIWILNPDIRVEKDTLSILVETMEKDSTLAAVGPRILHRKHRERIFSDGEKMMMDETARTHHKNHNLEFSQVPGIIDYDVDYIAGSSMLLNSKAIIDIGKLPEDYFLYFEETDWCFKARQHNWKLAINTHSRVFNLTSSKSSTFHYYFSRNKLIFCKKYHPDYKGVRNQMGRGLLNEISLKFKGKYLRPYFKSRLKGFAAGLIKTAL